MNAYMNIQVRVLSKAAQAQVKALQGQVAALQGQLAAANATAAAPGGMASPKYTQQLAKWGNQVQWTGRQLQYNWTLPILLAGAAAGKFAIDNERAFTQVAKVYGSTQQAADFFMKKHEGMSRQMAEDKAARIFAKELEALEEAFIALSSHYGVAQKEVLDTAAAWASAGQSGVDLAKSTELSLRTAVLGELELAKATEALIAIQAQYSMNTEELTVALAQLNSIENETGIRTAGLIDGFQRAAGVAREAGIDVRHLGAMLAALVPAAGTASNAGNALKTIISRLMSPTQEAAQVMNEMGLAIESSAWVGMTALDRMKLVAEEFSDGMSDSQKQVAASVLGSRWQLNKFLILMRELGPEIGFYERALNATKNTTDSLRTAEEELNKVLESNPKKLEHIWYTLQNGMATAIQPMIPYILWLMNSVKELVNSFNELDPSMQKFILLSLLALAAVGPIVKYVGTTATLIGTLGHSFAWAGLKMGGFLFGLEKTDEGLKKNRAGLFTTIGAWLAWPFRKIHQGFGVLVAGLTALTRFLGVHRAATVIWAATTAALHTVFWRTVIAGWTRGYMLMAIIATQGWGAIAAMIGRGSAVAAASMKLGMMLSNTVLIFGAMLTAVKFHLAAMIGRIIAFGASTVGITSGFWGTVWAIQAAATSRIIGLQVVLSSGLWGIWAAMYVKLAALSAAFWTKMHALWAAMALRLAPLMAVAARATTAVWAAMHVAMAAVSKAFWTAMIRLWMIGMVGILKAPALLAAGIRVVWANILLLIKLYGKQIIRAVLGPWGWLAVTVVALISKFRDQIAQVWQNIVNYFSDSSNGMVAGIIHAWNLLPQGVANALTAVARIVQQAALQIYEWFSYINPFARHSPSLVENVRNGMAAVRGEFAKTSSIGNSLKGAYRDIAAFGKAVAGITGGARSFEQAQQRAKIKKFAPGALGEYDRLAKRLPQLTGMLGKMAGAIRAQEAVVGRWEQRLAGANKKLDKQQAKLERLQDVAAKWQEKLDAANDRLAHYASSPIKGMGAMEDAIFANEMAQKKLRLEMMKMEEAGGTLDDIRNKLALLNGEQENLSGRRNDLRSAGAGSEITKTYDDQIKAIEKQKRALAGASAPLEKMQTDLDKLAREAEILDLEKSLKFDPLTRAIEKAAYAMEELPFDKIMSGVTRAKEDIARYSEKVEEANKAVERQQKVVDAATEARDRISERLDKEQNQLSNLKDKYQAIEDVIRDIESAMSDAASAADAMEKALEEKKKKKKGAEEYVSPGLKNFRDAAGGNFAQVGGSGIPDRKDWSSEVPDIKQFTADLGMRTGELFGDLDPFGPIKKKWGEFKSWMKGTWNALWGGVKDFAEHAVAGINFDGAKKGLGNWGDWLKKKWDGIWSGLKNVGKLFLPDLRRIGDDLKKIWDDAVAQIWPEIKKFEDLWEPLKQLFATLWPIIKVVAAVLGGVLLAAIKIAASVISTTLGPVLETIIAIIGDVIQVFRGLIEFVVGVLTLDWQLAWQGIKDVVIGTFELIGNVIKGAGKIIWGIVKGVVVGIWEFFVWLWDVLVGHSIVPDMVDGIVKVFKTLASLGKWIWNNVLKPIYNFFVALWKDYVKPAISLWWEGIKTAWSALKAVGGWVWDNVLKPVFNWFKGLWSDKVRPELAQWWDRIKSAWNVLKTFGAWVWDNVLKPVFNWFKDLWADKVRPELTQWLDRLKNVWSNLKDLGGWIWQKVLQPIKQKFVDIWHAIRDWFVDNGNIIVKPIKGVVNLVIEAINSMIRGLNKIADVLPGIDWSIDLIPKLASGGEIPQRKVGSGFKTSGARAIVGEGKQNYPEFVVPTDPTHRKRALGLHKQLSQKLGVYDPDMFAEGGILPKNAGGLGDKIGAAIGSAKNLAKGGMDWVKGNLEKLASTAFGLARGSLNGMINQIGWKYGREAVNSVADQVFDWVGAADKQYAEKAQKAMPPIVGGAPVSARGWTKPLSGGYSIGGSLGSYPGHTGLDLPAAGGTPIRSIRAGTVTASYDIPGSNSYNDTPYASYGRVVKVGHDNGYSSLYAHMSNRVARAGQKVAAGSLLGYVGTTGKSSGNHLHLEIRNAMGGLLEPRSFLSSVGVPLAKGAIVRRRAGGTLARIGEGRTDEAVTPLPRNWRSEGIGHGGGDETVINIYGNLEFPNIDTAEDADVFIANLKSLAGGAA